MSCLLIKNDGIGDLILASGVIASLSDHFDGQLDLLTCEENKEVASQIPGVRHTMCLSRDKLRFLGSTRLPWGDVVDLRAMRALLSKEYACVICLRRFIRQSSLVAMSCCSHIPDKRCMWQIPTNISHEYADKHSNGYTRFSGPWEVRSELLYYRHFLKDNFGISNCCRPHLRCTDEAVAAAPRARFGDRMVAMGISGASSRWPLSHWISLGRQLVADGWEIVLLGGAREGRLAGVIAQFVPCKNLVGLLNYAETARVLGNMRAFIGNDTGLTHFASLIVNPVVVIQGGGTFGRFFPWPDSTNQYLIFSAMDCFDCNWDCKYKFHKCLEAVQPETVVAYFRDVVDGRAERMRNVNPTVPAYTLSWRIPGRNGLSSASFASNAQEVVTP